MLLIKLLLAHILGDYIFQWRKMVEDKERKKLRSPYLYLHVIIHIILILLITYSFEYWFQAVIIGVLHFFIDWVKLSKQEKNKLNERRELRWFLIDQGLHITVILIVWKFTENMVFDESILNNYKVMLMFTSILFIISPTSIIIKKIISIWMPNLKANNEVNSERAESSSLLTIIEKIKSICRPNVKSLNQSDNRSVTSSSSKSEHESLEYAGSLIGIIERLLILIFIFNGKWEGVGFLLTAKSVFRFGELSTAKDKKLTEYVLIGTLLSFGIAIIVGYITLKLINCTNCF